MLIYSHNLHEKLFGYAISREFIKYQTPFCDLLDDPTLILDFELAIGFNQAINGNLNARVNFTNTLILCSTDIDMSTLEFYKHKMETYPIFATEISRINYTFGNINRLPGDNGGFIDKLKNALKDCLNSPCNLFTPTSNSVGKLAQGTLFANDISVLAAGSLKDAVATFTGGIDACLFNKIPAAFQNGIANLKLIGKNAWSESQTMLTKDSLPELIEKAQNGESLRTNTSGYRYTPDIKSYFDLNGIASAILGGVASDMGDCFRRYQQSVRYNPYDPNQNQSFVSRSPIVDQVNGTTYYHTVIGQPAGGSNTGGEIGENLSVNSTGNKRLEVTAETIITPYYNFNPPGRGGTGKLTAYTSILEGTKFLTDSTTDPDTQAGRTFRLKSIPLQPPNSYTEYTRLYNQGKTNNTDISKIDKNKFNNGFAMNMDFLCKLIGNNFTRADIYKIVDGKQTDKWIYAEITPSGGAKQYVQLIDTNIAKDSATSLDLTAFAWNTLFPQQSLWDQAENKVGLVEKDGSGIEQYTYSTAPPVSAKVRIIVGKLSDMNTQKGLTPRMIQLIKEFKAVYPSITITSEYRSPTYNAKVGGAEDSQHTLGNAIDLSVRGLDISTTMQIFEWWKARGAYGFGYYTNSSSIHVDIRENGQYAAWGTNYSRSSLPGTPPEFQAFARSLGVRW
jgi:aryl carrier-like protein